MQSEPEIEHQHTSREVVLQLLHVLNMCMSVNICVYVFRERRREQGRETDRDRETERERDRERHSARERDRENGETARAVDGYR